MKIQIKNRFTERGANLRGADLYGADLRRANLRGAKIKVTQKDEFLKVIGIEIEG